MLQNILSVRTPVIQLTEQFDNVNMKKYFQIIYDNFKNLWNNKAKIESVYYNMVDNLFNKF